MSRFISAGTEEEPTERDEAWQKAQQEIEAKQLQKAEEGKHEDGGKTLYETLQANKAAKQEAFEESTRLRNQFRSLDEDEVDYLDSVLESTRAKEAEVTKETTEQLSTFRQQQEEAEKAARSEETGGPPERRESWQAGPRKRKKARESGIGGLKVRRTSTNEKQIVTPGFRDLEDTEEQQSPTVTDVAHDQATASTSPVREESSAKAKAEVTTTADIAKSTESTSPPATKPPSPPPTGLGLGAYSSDEDD